jgi:hypothetical protein
MAKIGVGKTNLAIYNGQVDLTEWSEEELVRGQRRSKRGTWEGRPPKVVPKAVHDELVRRKLSQAYELMRDNVVKATGVLIEIATDKEVDAAVRLKAVDMIQNRVMGRAPERVALSIEPEPWLIALRAGVVSIGADPPADIEDAELVADNPDDF